MFKAQDRCPRCHKIYTQSWWRRMVGGDLRRAQWKIYLWWGSQWKAFQAARRKPWSCECGAALRLVRQREPWKDPTWVTVILAWVVVYYYYWLQSADEMSWLIRISWFLVIFPICWWRKARDFRIEEALSLES